MAWDCAELPSKTKMVFSIESVRGKLVRERGATYIDGIEPGTEVAIRVRQTTRRRSKDYRTYAGASPKCVESGDRRHEQLILSRAQIYFDHDILHLSSADISELSPNSSRRRRTPQWFLHGTTKMASSNDT